MTSISLVFKKKFFASCACHSVWQGGDMPVSGVGQMAQSCYSLASLTCTFGTLSFSKDIQN